MPMPDSPWTMNFWCPSSVFGRAYLLSLAGLLLFTAWIVFDCSFRWIPHIVGQDLRFRFIADSHLRSMHSWQLHGPRLLVFLLLALFATATVGVVAGRLVMGSERERSIKCMLLAIGLVACWLGLATSWKGLWWLAFRYRIARHHDAMKAAVNTLSDRWPTSRVDLQEICKVR